MDDRQGLASAFVDKNGLNKVFSGSFSERRVVGFLEGIKICPTIRNDA